MDMLNFFFKIHCSKNIAPVMKISQYEIEGVISIDLECHGDERGFFLETYQKNRYKQAGIDDLFVQDNRSVSKKGVLRGLHYQISRPIGQLIYVARGSIFDVGVDLRHGSDTFGEHVSFELNENDHKQIYLPPGVAHGFCTLSDLNEIHYKCTEYYFPNDEGGIHWQDEDINIDWPIQNPEVNDRDASFPRLKDLSKDCLPD